MHFLPRGSEPHQVVQQLLAGDNFHFGNPFLKWQDPFLISSDLLSRNTVCCMHACLCLMLVHAFKYIVNVTLSYSE